MTATARRVVLFGTFDESMHPRVRVLAEAVASAGHEVIRCNAPVGISTDERVAVFRKPWRLPLLAARLIRAWWHLIRRSRSIEPPIDVVIVGYLGVFDVHLARALFGTKVILDQMAPVGGIGRDRRLPLIGLLDLIDRWATRAADLVLVDTAEHLPASASHAEVVHVGAPDAWFSVPRRPSSDGVCDDSDPARKGLRVCFFGLFTPLQGAEVIAGAIAELQHRTDICWTLIGDGQDRAQAETMIGTAPNVTWIDWVDGDDLPAIVAGHDVCLGIFGTTPKAARVVPNKVFQGAAAGCAIITSNTAPQRVALGDAGVLIPPGDHRALAAAIEELADDPAELAAQKQAARDRADESFTPAVIAERVGAIIQSVAQVSERNRRDSDHDR